MAHCYFLAHRKMGRAKGKSVCAWALCVLVCVFVVKAGTLGMVVEKRESDGVKGVSRSSHTNNWAIIVNSIKSGEIERKEKEKHRECERDKS